MRQRVRVVYHRHPDQLGVTICVYRLTDLRVRDGAPQHVCTLTVHADGMLELVSPDDYELRVRDPAAADGGT